MVRADVSLKAGTLGHHGQVRVSRRAVYERSRQGTRARDEAIQLASLERNAILITADNGMKGSAQAKGLFVLEL